MIAGSYNQKIPTITLQGNKSYKLVSRILFQYYHLSGINITAYLLLPTLDHRAGSPQAILYVAFQHPRFTRSNNYLLPPWALTPHFHLCPASGGIVIFCGTVCPRLLSGARLFTGGLPYAVRTFLHGQNHGDSSVCS